MEALSITCILKKYQFIPRSALPFQLSSSSSPSSSSPPPPQSALLFGTTKTIFPPARSTRWRRFHLAAFSGDHCVLVSFKTENKQIPNFSPAHWLRRRSSRFLAHGVRPLRRGVFTGTSGALAVVVVVCLCVEEG